MSIHVEAMAFGNTEQLDILVTLQNKASAGIKQLSASLAGLENDGKTLSGAFSNVGKMFSTEIGIMQTAAKTATVGLGILVGALTTAGFAAVRSASDYEQSQIAFETMLGSADKARQMLQDITKFAKETPFELPEIVEASKKLMAYGVVQEEVIPKMKMLGDIAAGVGRDRLPYLILAFGQIKAKGKLAGQELNQLSEAGVPLRQILVDLANKGEGVFSSFSKTSDITKALGKSTSNAKLEWSDLEKAMEKGLITYDMVDQSLKTLTDDGGRFHNLMIRQSTTLGGLISNLSDSMSQLARKVVGMNTEGEVREGSLFDRLRKGAAGLYSYLNDNQEAIANFFSEKLDSAVQKVKEWWDSIGGAQGMIAILGNLWDTLQNQVIPALGSLIGVIMDVSKWVKDNWDWIWKLIAAYEALKVVIAVNGLLTALSGLSTSFGLITVAAKAMLPFLVGPTGILIAFTAIEAILVTKVIKSFYDTQDAMNAVRASAEQTRQRLDNLQNRMGTLSTKEMNDKFQTAINKGKEMADQADAIADRYSGLKGVFNAVGDWASDMWNKTKKYFDKINESNPSGKEHGGYVRGRATGGNPMLDELTLVGESGPELVKLPVGSKVIPNYRLNQGGGGNVYNFNFSGAVVTDRAGLMRMIEDYINRKTELRELGATA